MKVRIPTVTCIILIGYVPGKKRIPVPCVRIEYFRGV